MWGNSRSLFLLHGIFLDERPTIYVPLLWVPLHNYRRLCTYNCQVIVAGMFALQFYLWGVGR